LENSELSYSIMDPSLKVVPRISSIYQCCRESIHPCLFAGM